MVLTNMLFLWRLRLYIAPHFLGIIATATPPKFKHRTPKMRFGNVGKVIFM
jgi:hypothetical protein